VTTSTTQQVPTMWEMARTPRWIGGLVFALAVAALFALLGQWQFSRAVASGVVVERATETTVPLESVAKPQSGVTEDAAGQMVSTQGTLVPDSFVVLSGRSNQGMSGYWVTAEFLTTETASSGNQPSTDASSPALAVALGWAPTEEAASSAISGLAPDGVQPITGRYLATEPPSEDDFEAGEQNSASVAALLNQWPTAPASVYGGYLVSDQAVAGLDVIDSPTPSTEVTLNWLNVFYAIEWAVFAGVAVFLWFRLLRDAHERELEEAAEVN
jgi:surfeit locus 1 family protein